MAGAGNIWKHETLYHCGVNPWRLVSELDDETIRSLVPGRASCSASVGKPGPDGVAPRRPTMGLRTCWSALPAVFHPSPLQPSARGYPPPPGARSASRSQRARPCSRRRAPPAVSLEECDQIPPGRRIHVPQPFGRTVHQLIDERPAHRFDGRVRHFRVEPAHALGFPFPHRLDACSQRPHQRSGVLAPRRQPRVDHCWSSRRNWARRRRACGRFDSSAISSPIEVAGRWSPVTARPRDMARSSTKLRGCAKVHDQIRLGKGCDIDLEAPTRDIRR